jgi:hypothetical protein
MSRPILRRLVLTAAAPLVALSFVAARPFGETTQVAGTYTMKYSQRHPIPVAGAEGHVLMATEATGANKSTGPSSFEEGAKVTIIETADITQGSGLHQGYAVVSSKDGLRVSQWSGKLTTVMGPDNQPTTSFKGTWTSVKGPAGRGTYEGRITGPDSYTVQWAGEVSTR